MKVIKDRKIFALSNFRGLDTENKEIKVAPFRATKGKNFIIDSGTLKTRPNFEFVGEPFAGNKDINIIDFYKYRDVMVYITSKGFVFKYKDKIVGESESDVPRVYNVYTNVLNKSFEFNGKKPLFQEEKDCLFVFCLDNIFVISLKYGGDNLDLIALYPLDSKINKLTKEEEKKWFEKLPSPYEPTLFIGDNRLEDTNLLSKNNKYKFFVDNNSKTPGEYISLYLPTSYDEKKNAILNEDGTYVPFGEDNYDIKIYNGKYNTQKEKPYFSVFPIFLGKYNENFHSDLGELGDIINDGLDGKPKPIEIEETYAAKEIFEYKKGTVISPIKQILGLTREEFFEMKAKTSDGNKINVYEYLLDFIKNNMELFTDNKLYQFNLHFSCICKYINEGDSSSFEIVKEEKTEKIYVQFLLKETLSSDIGITSQKTLTNSISKNGSEPELPSYIPNPSGEITPIGHSYILNGDVPFENYSESQFKKDAQSYIDTVLSPKFSDYLGVYEIKATSRSVSLVQEKEVIKYEDDSRNWFFGSPNLPDNSYEYNPNQYNAIDLGDSSSDSTWDSDIDYYKLKENMSSEIRYYFKNHPASAGKKYCFILNYTHYWEVSGSQGGDFDSDTRKVACIAEYIPEKNYSVYNAYSYVMYLNISSRTENKELANKDLFKIEYDKETNSFVFKYKNYFYNYNKTPLIEITTKFDKNEDYDIIAKMRFGITFGSENRLFLAGNEKFPNIDRYNVSNDLLGDNEESQSYELSYFPSKNYRVVGGKGAINGYVIANDTQLYITKENYPNDQKIFIRNRIMDDNGIVGYNEFKTNIGITPLNNLCTARFFNDTLILSEDGLYGLEITDNVITNERLIQLRSSFINKELKNTIKNYKEGIFIFEDNKHLNIIIGNIMYVADSRYADRNPNGEISNYSYEFVKWELPFGIKKMKKIGSITYMLDSVGKGLYTFKDNSVDKILENGVLVEKPIKVEWQSSILDLGNKLYEKTLFKTFVYATKQGYGNTIKIGYRTMRRYNDFGSIMANTNPIVDISNPIDLNSIGFNLFALNTFSNFGSSINTKENNFLYIQVLIVGEGKIEINELEFEYKNNRLLKTIG